MTRVTRPGVEIIDRGGASAAMVMRAFAWRAMPSSSAEWTAGAAAVGVPDQGDGAGEGVQEVTEEGGVVAETEQRVRWHVDRVPVALEASDDRVPAGTVRPRPVHQHDAGPRPAGGAGFGEGGARGDRPGGRGLAHQDDERSNTQGRGGPADAPPSQRSLDDLHLMGSLHGDFAWGRCLPVATVRRITGAAVSAT